ncbi:MAG TPA: hypothetical protein VFH51_05910 [Myxococcota bacterium]|nr:hypothetical protein [Myxococcota bacterium]
MELAPIASGAIAAYLEYHVGHSLKALTTGQLARQREALTRDLAAFVGWCVAFNGDGDAPRHPEVPRSP